MSVITRFAPSPTGYLHSGHAYSAYLNFQFAKKHKGIFLLRIEDIDYTRCRKKFETGIYEDLNWLGIQSPLPALRQSEFLPLYRNAILKLIQKKVLYPCQKSRRERNQTLEKQYSESKTPLETPSSNIYKEELQASFHLSGKPVLSRQEKGSENKKTYAWRLSLKACKEYLKTEWNQICFMEYGQGPQNETGLISLDPESISETILARKDIGISYHIAVCIDDARQGVTDIIRGQDLFYSTHIHRILQKLLDLPEPRYWHHKLITESSGQKLAKRKQSKSLKQLRKEGVLPEELLKNWH